LTISAPYLIIVCSVVKRYGDKKLAEADPTESSDTYDFCSALPAEWLPGLRAEVEAATGVPFDTEMPYVFEWGGYPIVGVGTEVLYLMAGLADLIGFSDRPSAGSAA
jgi:hypothetical protein